MTLEQALNAAVNLQRGGRLDDAERVYRQILSQQPECADALHLLGVLCAQRQKTGEAIELIGRAISIQPGAAGFHANLASVLFSAGKAAEAAGAYREFLRLAPGNVEGLLGLGIALKAAGDLREAELRLSEVLTIDPNNVRAIHHRGEVWLAEGKLAEAESAFRRAIALQPSFGLSHNSLGNLLSQSGRFDAAIEQYQAVLQVQPQFADAWSNLSNALREKRRYQEAIAAAQKAIALRPDFAGAFAALGNALRESGQKEEAIEQYRRALALRDDLAPVLNNLAITLADRRRFDEALGAIDQALKLRPRWAIAWNNRGKILRDAGRLEEAAGAIKTALEIEPEMAGAHVNLAGVQLDNADIDAAWATIERALQLDGNLAVAHNLAANILKEAGDVAGAIAHLDRTLELDPANADHHSNKVYLLEFDPRCDAKQLLAEQRKWDERHGQPMKQFIRPIARPAGRPDRLRIGYLSPYFRDHAESFFVVPLLEGHRHDEFEIHCFSDTEHTDAITERMKRSADRWHVTTGLNALDLAERIRSEKIDVLVDLAMHMAFNRATVLAQKPAAVQLSWLAYPGGMGMDAIDYRITDPWLDPEDADLSGYREKSIRLGKTWVCFDPLAELPPVSPRGRGPICFGSINNPCKINERSLGLWANVMRAVDDSRLLLQSLSLMQRRRIVEFMESRGISSDRLQFAPRCTREEYRKLYHRIDICLDPLPYNGITTTCDALWMGVPVVTRTGSTAAGRAGASILGNVGLDELIGRSDEAFIAAAVSLAGDASRLAELRQSLRERIRRSPLSDNTSFAREMETAYSRMWAEWQSFNAG